MSVVGAVRIHTAGQVANRFIGSWLCYMCYVPGVVTHMPDWVVL